MSSYTVFGYQQSGSITLNPNICVITDANGALLSSNISSEVLSYLNGLTGNIQTQLSACPQISTPLTNNRVMISTGTNSMTTSSISTTTLGFLDATSSIQTQLNGKQSTISLNNNIVPITNSSGALTSSTVTATTLGYLDVTSSVQTQLNSKQSTIALSNNIVPVTNGSGVLTSSTVSSTTLGYLDATSSVQTQLNFKQNAILPFTLDSGAICFGQKDQTMTQYTSAFVYSYTGVGVLRRLWIALSGPSPGNVFIRIQVDPSSYSGYQFGNTSTSLTATGINTFALAFDTLIQVGDGQQAVFATACLGSNIINSTQFGGYIALDMPFSQSIGVVLDNSQNSSVLTYWIQPFIETYSLAQMNLCPLRLYTSTFHYNNTAYNYEYPLVNVAGTNGVYLKGIKYIILGNSGGWQESRIRMYSGGTGMASPIYPATGFTNGTYQFSSPYMTGATVLWTSSGMEDFFLSSWGWDNTATSFSDAAGLLYNSSGTSGQTSTSVISLYRFFGVNGDSLPRSTGTNQFVCTLTSGDVQVSQSGSFSIYGVAFYYA